MTAAAEFAQHLNCFNPMSTQFLKDLINASLGVHETINVKVQRPNPLSISENYPAFSTRQDFKEDFRNIRKAAKALQKADVHYVKVERFGMSIYVL